MKSSYKHINQPFSSSFRVEKFHKDHPCPHSGLHYHDGYEIVYVKNGKGKIIIDCSEFEYTDGVLVFFGPCIPHFSFSNQTFKNNYEVVVHFGNKFIEEQLKVFPEFGKFANLINESKRFIVFSESLQKKLGSHFDKLVVAEPVERLIYLLDLLNQLSNSKNSKRLLEYKIGDSYAKSRQTRKILKYINENYHKKISTKDVANHVGLTTNSFCRTFKSLTQKSFIRYLNEYRINCASKLIEETDISISEIGFLCGFENQSYFSKTFFILKGVSPIDYRKNYNLNERLLFSKHS